MMGNGASAVCGRDQSTAIDQGMHSKTPKPTSTNTDTMQIGRTRNTVQLRKKADNKKSTGKHVL